MVPIYLYVHVKSNARECLYEFDFITLPDGFSVYTDFNYFEFNLYLT